MQKTNNTFKQNTFFLFWIMLFSNFNKNYETIMPLPKSFQGYDLIEELSSGDVAKYHRLGIYQNKNKQKSIIKWWTGNKQTFAFYSLLHEARMYNLIQKVHKRIGKKLPKELQNISTPKSIFIKTTSQKIVIMTEYREGVLLNEKNSQEQIATYSLSCKYLKIISENLTNSEIKHLPKRTVIDYLFLYPAILFFSIKRQPEIIPTLLHGIPNVLFAFLNARKISYTLVHRDLHTKNIIVSNAKTISIIDLQRLVLTYPIYEIVTTLAVEWENIPFRNFLIKSTVNDPLSKNIFKGFLINFATHALTANNLPKRYIDKYKAMLNYCVYKI